MTEKVPIRELSHSSAFVILLVLTLLMFGDVLFTGGDTILSREGADLARQFIYWRDFGFRELMHGNLPLWNPHLFSGAPFLGGFQSALLYPLNLVYLMLPLPLAINTGIALHVLLIGFFTYLWTAHRGLHHLSCLLASVLVMFSGAHFLHITAGHLSNLCTMTWAPLLLLSVDGLFRRPALPWCLLGIFALAMQILAGHPQYVYYTILTIILYAGVQFIPARRRIQAILGLAAMVGGAVSLAAIQIASGIDASGESIRSIGVSPQFAAMFSFPPENLITVLAPYFFGDMTYFPYWGRGYVWEMCPFIGVIGFTLAVYGAVHGNRRLRISCIMCAGFLMVLSLGAHTPLFSVLYHWLPGYAFFRGSAKFTFFAILFLSMLSCIGLDHIIRNGWSRKAFPVLVASGGIITGIAAACLFLSPSHPWFAIPWQKLIETVAVSRESYLTPSTFANASFMRESALFAAWSLVPASAILLLISLLLTLQRSYPRITYLIVLLAMVEVFMFARTARYTFDLRDTATPALAAFYRAHPGDYRVLNTGNPNSAMSLNAQDIWGYDPGIPLRYARFIAFTQGYDPDKVTQYMPFHRYDKLYGMLRCRYIIVPDGERLYIHEKPDVLPRLLMLKDWRLIKERTHIFREMARPAFDPRQTVILEDAPDPQPKADTSGLHGSCVITDFSTDHMTIRANLPEPAILLVTDSYSRGWQIRSLNGSARQRYRIVPANYTLMAVPLSAGAHHLRMEYQPLAFVVGKWISLFSLLVYLTVVALFIMKKIKRGTTIETENDQNH